MLQDLFWHMLSDLLLTLWYIILAINNCMMLLGNFLLMGLLNHILYNVNQVWKCVFLLRSNDYC
jgi:hypothetical protein